MFYGTCHTLLMLRFEYFLGNFLRALDATLWTFYTVCDTLLMLCVQYFYGTCQTLSLLRFEYYPWNLWNTSSATLWNILNGTCHTPLMLCFLNHKSTELAIHSQCLSMLRFEYSLGDLLHPLDAMLWQKTYGTCHTLSMFLNATDWIFSRGIVTRSLRFEHSLRNLPYALDAILWTILWGTCHTLLTLCLEYSLGNCKPNPRLMVYARQWQWQFVQKNMFEATGNILYIYIYMYTLTHSVEQGCSQKNARWNLMKQCKWKDMNMLLRLPMKNANNTFLKT